MKPLFQLLSLFIFFEQSIILNAQTVTIENYGLENARGLEHYRYLTKMVCDDFDFPTDSIDIRLVFIGDSLKSKLIEHNPERFDRIIYGYAAGNTVLIFSEADDTFAHELLHIISRRLPISLFIPYPALHDFIKSYEAKFIISKQYLNYLNQIK